MKNDIIKWTCKHCGKPIVKNNGIENDWSHSRYGFYGCKNEEAGRISADRDTTEAEPDLFKYYYDQLPPNGR